MVQTPGALMITGPPDTDVAAVKIQEAEASYPEDEISPSGINRTHFFGGNQKSSTGGNFEGFRRKNSALFGVI